MFAPPPEEAGGVRLDESRTARLERIVGKSGLRKLADSRVCVLGLGGVGSSCAEALVRGGIGNFVFVDQDVVQPSNLNRQAIAFQSTIGRPKIEVMAEMSKDINPDVNIRAYKYFLDSENIGIFMDDHIAELDYVVDAIDSISTKLALAEYFCKLERRAKRQSAKSNGIESDGGEAPDHGTSKAVGYTKGDRVPLLISSMGGGNKLDPTEFGFSDLYKTVNDPIARTMRKEGRKRGIDHLLVLSSSEHPVKTHPDKQATRKQRAGLGTMSYIPPIMGQMLAGYVIRDILKDDPMISEGN